MELIVIWIFIVLVLCLDVPLVWWMYKSRKKMRRFTLAPIFLVFAIPFFNQPKIPDSVLLETVGTTLATLGFVVMMMGGYEFYRRGIIPALSKKESSKIEPEEVSHELVTTGIYKMSRHPQYVGLLTFFIGYFLVLNAFYSLCLTPLILAWFVVIAYVEERYDLEVIFGDEYRKYKKKVGMFFPKFSI
jgi:protein-S-isoprenylcysteine O-methyltransferase Ste14